MIVKNILRELLILESAAKMFKWTKWTIRTDLLIYRLEICFYVYDISDICYVTFGPSIIILIFWTRPFCRLPESPYFGKTTVYLTQRSPNSRVQNCQICNFITVQFYCSWQTTLKHQNISFLNICSNVRSNVGENNCANFSENLYVWECQGASFVDRKCLDSTYLYLIRSFYTH